jgi:hypothetical protein
MIRRWVLVVTCTLLGLIVGIASHFCYGPGRTDNVVNPLGFLEVVPFNEFGKEINWIETCKGGWHVAVAWTDDNLKHETRLYAMRTKGKDPWQLLYLRHFRLGPGQLRVDRVDIDYEHKSAQVLDIQGILIETICFETIDKMVEIGPEYSESDVSK